MIADSSKTVDRIHGPIPLELKRFGLASTLERIGSELGEVAPRPDCPPSPDDGVIADYTGPVHEPGELAARLALTPGVVGATLGAQAWHLVFLGTLADWMSGVNRDRPGAHLGIGAFNLVRQERDELFEQLHSDQQTSELQSAKWQSQLEEVRRAEAA